MPGTPSALVQLAWVNCGSARAGAASIRHSRIKAPIALSIVSDAGGLPETVDETTGWVVPRNDVAALVAGLRQAYDEFTDGRLRLRGERAQRFALRHFDDTLAAGDVADVVEAACRTGGRA